MATDEELTKLAATLRELHLKLRDETHEKYSRINPFCEDLFDWKERGKYWVGSDSGVTIYNSTTVVGDVTIGEDTWVGPSCLLDGSGGLKIGRNCSVATGCQLLTHDTVKWALSGGKAAYEYAPVTIGDCCFIGTGATVVKGVSIGSHCLIGAGAVVTKDVPDFSIAAGVPAHIIGTVKVDGENVELVYDYSTR